MSESGAGRWIEFEKPAAEAERIQRAARRMGLVVEELAMPRFRVKVTDPEQAYDLGAGVAKAKRSGSARRRR